MNPEQQTAAEHLAAVLEANQERRHRAEAALIGLLNGEGNAVLTEAAAAAGITPRQMYRIRQAHGGWGTRGRP